VIPTKKTFVVPGLPKLNPGLKLANTFGVEESLAHFLELGWSLNLKYGFDNVTTNRSLPNQPHRVSCDVEYSHFPSIDNKVEQLVKLI
jgi:hypothetical protein